MIAEPHSSKSHRNSVQHDSGEKVSQDLDDGSTRIQSVETNPGHDELTLQTAGILPSASCDGAIQRDKSETYHLSENTTEYTKMFEQQNSDKAHLEVSRADKVSEALYGDSNTLKKNTVCGGKIAVESHCRNSALLHNKSSEARKNLSALQFAKQNTVCGGQIAVESHCCNLALLHNKSSEARKNLSAFLGTKQFAKQHDEQSTGKQQMAANSEDHLNGCNASKRQANHQSEADNPKDGEPGGQRKKQKINATSAACPDEVVTRKASFGPSSDVAPMYKHCVLPNKRKLVHVAEHEQPVAKAEARDEDGNVNSSHKAQDSSQSKCSPVANQNAEADKDDGLTNSHARENSDEIEATYWRNIRRKKARFQEKETAVSYNSKNALGLSFSGLSEFSTFSGLLRPSFCAVSLYSGLCSVRTLWFPLFNGKWASSI